jgi:hypothetical protein
MIHSSAKSINRQKAIFFLDIRVSPTVHTDQPKMLLAAKRATSSAVQLTESIVKTVVLEPATELGFAVHDVARDVLSVADDVADALEEAATDALSKHASAVLSSDGGAEVSGADAATHARLVAVYTEHNPSKLPAVPALVAKWRGREAQLFDALTTKYHLQQKPPALVAGGASATETAAVALSPVQQQTSHLRKRAGSTPGASPLSERTNEQQQQRVPMAPHTPATSRTAPATQAAAVATAAATTRRQEVGGATGSSTGHGGVAGIDLEALTFAQLMQLIEGELGLDPSLRPRESLELAREVLGLSGGAGSPGMVGGGASSLSLRDEALRVSGSGTPPPSSGAPLSCACSLHRSLPHSLTHSLRRTLVCRLLGSSCPVVECSCSLPLRRHHSCRRWALRSGSRRRMVTRGAEAEVMMSRPHRWWAHPAPHSRSRRAAAAAARPSWRRSCVDVRYKPPTHLEPGSPRAVGVVARVQRGRYNHTATLSKSGVCAALVGLLSAEKFVERVESTPSDDTVTTAGEDHVAKADAEAEAETETTGSPSLVSSSSSSAATAAAAAAADGSAESGSVSSLPTPAKQPPPQTEIAQGHGSNGAAADRATSSAAATDVAPRLSLMEELLLLGCTISDSGQTQVGVRALAGRRLPRLGGTHPSVHPRHRRHLPRMPFLCR